MSEPQVKLDEVTVIPEDSIVFSIADVTPDVFLSLESLEEWIKLTFNLEVIEIESDANYLLWTSMFLRGFIRAAMLIIKTVGEQRCEACRWFASCGERGVPAACQNGCCSEWEAKP